MDKEKSCRNCKCWERENEDGDGYCSKWDDLRLDIDVCKQWEG